MRTYTKKHATKVSYDRHVREILENGGIITSDVKKTITYGFPATSINKKYTHFAVRKSDSKIVNAWEYAKYSQADLNSDKAWYFFNDLKENDWSPSEFHIWTKQMCAKNGINPFDSENWYKNSI